MPDDAISAISQRIAAARPNGADPSPLICIDPKTLHGKPVPPRRWIVTDWVPVGFVTGLYGPGGTGKSLIAMQLITALTLAKPWLGVPIEQSMHSLGVFCEDDADELHRRQDAINNELHGCDFDALDGMFWLPRLGEDNVLLAFGRDGRAQLTPFYHQVVEMARDLEVRQVVIDTVADTYGGNQNDAGQVRQYVQSCLGRLAREIDGAVLACAHPSRTGMNSGSGESGSVQWDAAFRSRLYLAAPGKDEDGAEPDPAARVLSRKKSNYAARDDVIDLFWDRGVFKIKGGTAVDAERPDCCEVFMTLLDQTWGEGQWVSNSKNAPNYAPKLFALRSGRHGYKKADFERVMQPLFEIRAIKLTEFKTADRKPKERIARGEGMGV